MSHDTERETPTQKTAPDELNVPLIIENKSIFERFLGTKTKKIGASALATLVLGSGITAGFLTGHANADKAPDQARPTTSASVVPGTTESVRPTTSTSAETQTTSPNISTAETASTKIPESLVKYETMSNDEFAALPKSEQMKFWAWLTRNLDQYASDYSSMSKNPVDVLPVASQNNTSDEIETIAAYNLRYPLTLTDGDREKALIAGLYNGKKSPAYHFWETYYKTMPVGSLNGKVMGYTNSIIINPVVSSGTNQTGPSGEVSRKITFKDTDGSIQTRNAYLVTTELNGKTVSTWELP